MNNNKALLGVKLNNNFFVGLIFFIALLFSIGKIQAQNEKKYTYSLSTSVFRGFILRHSKEIGVAGNSFPAGFYSEFNRHHYGHQSWESRHRYPDFGVSFYYVNYNSPVTGRSYALAPHYKIYLGKKRDGIFRLTYKMGLGIGLNDTPYSRDTNHQNQLLGSRFCFSIPTTLDAELKINKQIRLNSGLSLIHFSNGAIKKPNKGINVIALTGGFRYHLATTTPSYQQNEEAFDQQSVRAVLILSGGAHEPNFVGAGAKPFFNLTAYGSKKVNHKIAWLAGVDVFWSLALKEDIQYDVDLEPGPLPDYKRAAVTAGFEYFINDLSIIGQIGVYFYDPYHKYAFFYERIGLKYYINPRLFTSLTLKAHYANAEMAELGVGYYLNQ
ncbi:MAG: acyloxyacyl hydrolase [Cyclobacteriaceae bacterium]|nr:acyloxyacyl hydrolase [Cyclobacteriaceae bacterium]